MRTSLLKRVVLCDDHCYYITDQDAEKLKAVSPGLARLVRDADGQQATHFVCEKCGQIPPLKLRDLHRCSEND